MRQLFGYYLPFLGFREEEIDDELRRRMGLPAHITHINTFQFAWFGYAVCIALGPVEDE